jgi:hypothetical protein
MAKVIVNGTRVEIRSPESQDNGQWGIVKRFDGEHYHIAIYNGINDTHVFLRSELLVRRNKLPPAIRT